MIGCDSAEARKIESVDFPLFGSLQALLGALGVLYLVYAVLPPLLGIERATLFKVPLTLRADVVEACLWGGMLAWLLVSFRRLVTDAAYALLFRRPSWRDVGWIAGGLVASFALNVVVLVAQARLGFPVTGSAMNRLLEMSPDAVAVYLFMILGIVLSPLVEEVAVRGILFGALVRKYGPLVAAVVSSIVFAAYHHEPYEFACLFADGMILAFVFVRTRSLLVSYALHAANNSIAFGAVAALRIYHHHGVA